MFRIPHRPLPNPGLDILLRRHLQHLLNIPRTPNLGPAYLNPLLNQRKHIEPRNRTLGCANPDEPAVGPQQLKILLQWHLGT